MNNIVVYCQFIGIPFIGPKRATQKAGCKKQQTSLIYKMQKGPNSKYKQRFTKKEQRHEDVLVYTTGLSRRVQTGEQTRRPGDPAGGIGRFEEQKEETK